MNQTVYFVSRDGEELSLCDDHGNHVDPKRTRLWRSPEPSKLASSFVQINDGEAYGEVIEPRNEDGAARMWIAVQKALRKAPDAKSITVRCEASFVDINRTLAEYLSARAADRLWADGTDEAWRTDAILRDRVRRPWLSRKIYEEEGALFLVDVRSSPLLWHPKSMRFGSYPSVRLGLAKA